LCRHSFKHFMRFSSEQVILIQNVESNGIGLPNMKRLHIWISVQDERA
jgi:hypothetical protein